jgi:hypothetical protein
MAGLVVSAIAYVRAYILSRNWLGLEAGALVNNSLSQAQTPPAFTAQHRPTLLGRPPVCLARLDRLPLVIVKAETVVSWHRARIPTVLAPALPATRSAATQRRGPLAYPPE